MKTLLRLESSPGVGIYVMEALGMSLESVKKIKNIRDIILDFYGTLSGKNHPNPHDDSLLIRNLAKEELEVYEVFYGFKNNAQFRAWFPEDDLLIGLGNAGVEIVKYEVEFLITGHAQSVTPKFGKERFRMNLCDFLNSKENS